MHIRWETPILNCVQILNYYIILVSHIHCIMYRPALPTLPTSTGTTVPSTPRSDVQNIWQTLNSSGICNLASFRTQRLGLLWIRGCTLTWVHSTRCANHFYFLETFYDHRPLLGCWWHHVSYHVWRSGPRWDLLMELTSHGLLQVTRRRTSWRRSLAGLMVLSRWPTCSQ